MAGIERLGLAPKGYILAVGRLVPEQGVDDLIDAFLASAQPEGRELVIAGGADSETDFVRALRARASDTVLFLATQTRSDRKRRHMGKSGSVLVNRGGR